MRKKKYIIFKENFWNSACIIQKGAEIFYSNKKSLIQYKLIKIDLTKVFTNTIKYYLNILQFLTIILCNNDTYVPFIINNFDSCRDKIKDLLKTVENYTKALDMPKLF